VLDHLALLGDEPVTLTLQLPAEPLEERGHHLALRIILQPPGHRLQHRPHQPRHRR
jgi:hypothetical protein